MEKNHREATLPPVFTRARCIFFVGVLLVYAALLLARLGHYALWDDEALRGLVAKGILQTGDTSVVLEHGNICLYRNGLDIRGFCDHSMPPLDAYVTAASFKLFGIDTWAARLPFALMGLCTLALILFWARGASWLFLLVLTFGFLGNVSLILFFRQCHYYAPAIFLSVAIIFLYWRGSPNPRRLLALAGLSTLLFLSNYLDYVALYACLTIDYLFWKRKEWPFSWRNGLLLFGPQILLNALAACVWNPLLTPHGAYIMANNLGDHLILFLRYWRDQNACEFFSLPVLLLAFGLGMAQHRTWIIRGCVALLAYVFVIAFVSPQPVRSTGVADVRLVAPIIPLALVLETGAICVLFEHRRILALGAALILFGTNLLNGGPLLDWGYRSTLLSYVMELSSPPPEPYTPVAKWINDHVPNDTSIWVQPDFATYPLMFHAPRVVYAWQLDWPPRTDFASLPPIHFKGKVAPNYIIAFGPGLKAVTQARQVWAKSNVLYEQVATIPIFWQELYRPELFWRAFRPFTHFDPNTEAVYIFQRSQPAVEIYSSSR